MYLHQLEPGTFFEFREGGFNFRRCLFVGIDRWGYCSFVHQTGGSDRFILNTQVHNSEHPIRVTTDVTQTDWDKPKFCSKDNNQ